MTETETDTESDEAPESLVDAVAALTVQDDRCESTACGADDAAPAATHAPHPFATDPGDHAETPLCAYAHIAPLLRRLAKRLGTTPAALRIYDPFYCEGACVRHLASLGFTSVININEDFYSRWAADAIPAFDVLLTNPPFSGDHLARTFEFATSCARPFLLLLPQYVSRKAFLLEWQSGARPSAPRRLCFVGPAAEPYVFAAPNREDVRAFRAPEESGGVAGSSAGGGNGTCEAGAGDSESGGGRTQEERVGEEGREVAHVDPVSVGARGDLLEAARESGGSEAGWGQSSGGRRGGNGRSSSTGSAASSSDSGGGTARSSRSSGGGAIGAITGSAAASASGAAAGAPCSPSPPPPSASPAFSVAAGSFQCVWFVSLGEPHHKPVVEWWRAEAARGALDGSAALASDVADLPQLHASPRVTPAERRWRKKQAEAAAALAARGEGGSPDTVSPFVPRSGGGRSGGGGRDGTASSGRNSAPGGRGGGRAWQQPRRDAAGWL